MFLATLMQIVEAPKPKAPRRARKSSIKARIERERKEPKAHAPRARNAQRSAAALALLERTLTGRALTVTEIADATGLTVAGAYSALHRLKALDMVKKAGEQPPEAFGRPILRWTWNKNPDPKKQSPKSEHNGKTNL